MRDVIIIIFYFRERFFVTGHQLFDMDIFLPFNRSTIFLALLLERFSYSFRLRLVLLLHLGALPRELFPQVVDRPIMGGFQ